MSNWTDWVLCKVTAVMEHYESGVLKRSVTMLPVGENNGNVFSFNIPTNVTPPNVGDEFRFKPLAAPKPSKSGEQDG